MPDPVEGLAQELLTQCEALARTHSGTPVRLEALWDGDTTGWFVYLTLTIRCPLTEQQVPVDVPRLGGDLRLFQGGVPPWPERLVAQRLGALLAARYGAELWFPSPEHPDDECPTYIQRDQAAPCDDCGKLILPPARAYRPETLCSRCHSDQQGLARLRAPVADEVVTPCFHLFTPQTFCSFSGSKMSAQLCDLLRWRRPAQDPRSDATYTPEDVSALVGQAEAVVDALLAAAGENVYRMDRYHQRLAARFGELPPSLGPLLWRGREVFSRVDEIRNAIMLAHFLQSALDSGHALTIYVKALYYRDDTVRCWLRVQDTPTEAATIARWADDIGSAQDVVGCLGRLEAAGCVVRGEAGALRLTDKGRRI